MADKYSPCYSKERLPVRMLRCWWAIPFLNRHWAELHSPGFPLKEESFGWNHLFNLTPLILIFPYDSFPWYISPILLNNDAISWPILSTKIIRMENLCQLKKKIRIENLSHAWDNVLRLNQTYIMYVIVWGWCLYWYWIFVHYLNICFL